MAVFAAMLWALNGLPLDRPMNEAERPSFLLEAANGEPLGRIGPMRSADVALKDISPILVNAVLSIEDRRFRYHLGVDPIGIVRAAHRNEQAGGVVQGGSTITQQLVKMRYVGDDRTYTRKAARGADRAVAGNAPQQGRDPHALSQRHLHGRRRLRRGGGVAAVLQQAAGRT